MSKKRKESVQEKIAAKAIRELMKANRYDATRDWGALCVTFVKVRPEERGDSIFMKVLSDHRMTGEADADTNPAMTRILKETMLKALENGVRHLREDLADEEDALVETKVISPVMTNPTDEQMEDALGSYIAREEGRIQ